MTAPDYADLRAAAEQMLRHTHTDTKRDWLNDQSAYEQAARPETILALLDAHDTARADGLANGADLRAQLEMALATMEAERDDLRAVVARVSALVEPAKERAERAERRCRVEHPTNSTVIDCMLVRGHNGDHWSTSGCAGGEVTWPAAEARVLPLPATVAQAVAEAQNVPFAGTKQRRIADAVLALLSGQPTVDAVRREAKVEALREAADVFQVNTWADLIKGAGAIGNGQRVTDWLRDRADRIASGGQA